MTYINYNDPQSVLRQNQTPNAGCMIGGEFYDIRNLLHRIEALGSENARLRGVLYDIANIDPPDEWNNSSGIKALRLVAKEALA